ncbi:hypothetical protein ACIGAN_15075 [Streptomyces sp. NPDC085931]|uniref:hypothetical protein n=1 Tax=Streptomyces sp. NPDC085931 TaxID=3365740 RepID=UPI0037CE0D9E
MPASTAARRAPLATTLALAGALALTGCGELRAPDARPGAAPGGPPSSTAPGASPYVEPGAGDGAPHHGENNAHRRPGAMSPGHARDAEREADRIRPVLRRLWEQRRWDPATVKTALLRLGYEEERVGADGTRLGGTLTVTAMLSRYEDGRYVTPEGARVALRVHDDACVTAFVQPPNVDARANGPYRETGCFAPPVGH